MIHKFWLICARINKWDIKNTYIRTRTCTTIIKICHVKRKMSCTWSIKFRMFFVSEVIFKREKMRSIKIYIQYICHVCKLLHYMLTLLIKMIMIICYDHIMLWFKKREENKKGKHFFFSFFLMFTLEKKNWWVCVNLFGWLWMALITTW